MEINNHNNLAFKTKIRVVSPNKFRAIIEEFQEKGAIQGIKQYDIMRGIRNPEFKSFVANAENICTKHIRSCTGVIVADKNKKASLFGHFYNSKENLKDIKHLEPYMAGTNAILIGSKWQFDYSTKVFNGFRDKIKKRKLPLTILKTLNFRYEANMAYFSANDELLLTVKDSENPQKYIRNMYDMRRVFGRVKISPTDTINFETKPKPTILERFKKIFREKNKNRL